MVCDLKTALENGAGGGTLIGVIWAMVNWVKSRKKKPS